jgi:hypothetical protein
MVNLDPVLLPAFAPLNAPMIAHLAVHVLRCSPNMFLADAQAARSAVYTDIARLVANESLTVGAFLSLLRASASPRRLHRCGHVYEIQSTKATIDSWRAKHLLRMQSRGRPHPQSIAAILIARRISRDRVIGWLPARLDEAAPHWWCWRQDSPEAAPQPCQVPLPAHLAASALLWTPWRGAAWDAEWIDIGNGCARWSVPPSISCLSVWDPQIGPACAVLGLSDTERAPTQIAERVLRRLADDRLAPGVCRQEKEKLL